jgi:hypothetical protein
LGRSKRNDLRIDKRAIWERILKVTVAEGGRHWSIAKFHNREILAV